MPIGDRGQLDVDPGDVAAVLPGDRQRGAAVAGGDLTAGVALELVAPAEAQVAADRQEPPRDALRGGDRVPEIVDRGLVGALGDDGPTGSPVPLAVAHRPRDRSQVPGDVDLIVHGRSYAYTLIFVHPDGCPKARVTSGRPRMGASCTD